MTFLYCLHSTNTFSPSFFPPHSSGASFSVLEFLSLLPSPSPSYLPRPITPQPPTPFDSLLIAPGQALATPPVRRIRLPLPTTTRIISERFSTFPRDVMRQITSLVSEEYVWRLA